MRGNQWDLAWGRDEFSIKLWNSLLCHDMAMLYALWPFVAGIFHSQRASIVKPKVFSLTSLNKPLNKQPSCWWFDLIHEITDTHLSWIRLNHLFLNKVNLLEKILFKYTLQYNYFLSPWRDYFILFTKYENYSKFLKFMWYLKVIAIPLTIHRGQGPSHVAETVKLLDIGSSISLTIGMA